MSVRRRKQPTALKVVCFKELCKYLSDIVRYNILDHQDVHPSNFSKEMIEKYIKLPHKLKNEIFFEIQEMMKYDFNSKTKSMFEFFIDFLLTPSTQSVIWDRYLCQKFCSQFPHLRTETILISKLKNCFETLNVLYIPFLSTDMILKAVAETCPFLRKLDVSHSLSVSEIGIRYLLGLETYDGCWELCYCNLSHCYNIQDSYEIYVLCLTRLRDLEELVVVDYECETLCKAIVDSERLLKLKTLVIPCPSNYELDYDDDYEYLAYNLPKLSRVVGPHLSDGELGKQHRLFRERVVEELIVKIHDYVDLGLYRVLIEALNSLTVIDISVETSVSTEEVMDDDENHFFNSVLITVGYHCRNLRELSLSGRGTVGSQLTQVISSHRRRNDVIDFTNLKALKLDSHHTLCGEDDGIPFRKVDRDLFLDLLHSASHCLRVLHLRGNYNNFLHDEFLVQVIEEGCFQCLEDLSIESTDCPLSKESLDKLVDQCMTLRKLELSGWNLYQEDAKVIQNSITLNNYDLTFIYH